MSCLRALPFLLRLNLYCPYFFVLFSFLDFNDISTNFQSVSELADAGAKRLDSAQVTGERLLQVQCC